MANRIEMARHFLRGYRLARRYRDASRERIEGHQRVAWGRLIRDVSARAAFYHPYRNASLADLPVLDKGAYLQDFDRINTVGLTLAQCETHGLQAERDRNFSPDIQGITVGLSSGTSQRRGVFLVSAAEKAAWAGYVIAKNIPFSMRRRKVALVLRANSNLYEASNGLAIAFRYFDLTRPLPELVDQLNHYAPDILIAPAHVLHVLATAPITCRPDKIISVAEVLEAPTRQRLQQRFGIRVDEIYQATEGYIASTCSEGNLHLNEDVLIVEKDWLDRRSGRFVPIITDLNRRTLPVIRYRLDDILVADNRPCSCGSAHLRLARIEGRMDDIIWLPDGRAGDLQPVFPDTIRRAMYICEPAVTDYRIVQDDGVLDIYCADNDDAAIETRVEASLRDLFSRLGLTAPSLVFHRSVAHSPQQKFRRIQCRRKPGEGMSQ